MTSEKIDILSHCEDIYQLKVTSKISFPCKIVRKKVFRRFTNFDSQDLNLQ